MIDAANGLRVAKWGKPVTDGENWLESKVTRRSTLATPLALCVATTMPAFARAKSTSSQLERDVATYVGYGEHRAGTKTERQTARWLAQRLTRLGYRTEQQNFPIHTVLNPGGRLSVGDTNAAVFPQWLPPASSLSKTIKAPLLGLDAPAGSPSIRLLTNPARLSANWIEPFDAYVSQAQAKGALALVMAINDPSDDLFVCNQHHAEPMALPVALVARRSLTELNGVIGSVAELTLRGRSIPTNAINVIGRKPGKGKAIVVSTPLTGWFQCGGERGPGIALWLRMAAFLAKQDRPVLILGTGSHEIGHLGMEYALKNGAPPPADVALWLHFGASLAATKLDQAYNYKSGQYLVGTDITAKMAREHLIGVMPVYVPGTPATLGEAGQVIGAGHQQFVGLSGQFPTFHTPLDRGDAIDFELLERIGIQAESLIEAAISNAM
jgi:hypothetical protein